MAEFIGSDEADVIIGVDGDDTITGGRGADTLSGGGGHDLFLVEFADSSAIDALSDPDGATDVIADWSLDDRLIFVDALPPEDDSLFAGVAADYTAAFDLAQTAFGEGFEYASIKVGADVFVFAPRTDSVVKLAGIDVSAVSGGSLSTDMSEGEAAMLSASAEHFDGGDGADTVHGLEGEDTLRGGEGGDQMFGGLDNDSIDGGEGLNYLRGDEGDDYATGGAQHDDINGNMGRDTLFSGAGDDWVRGGKDDDTVLAGAGNDLAFGDLGHDTVGGNDGNDAIQGGEGDDLLRGDDGNDTLAGDLGDDTLNGGLGADVIVASGGAGEDLVMGFNASEGDRVQLDPQTAFTLSQEGSDTVIEMAAGRMVLVGVQLSSLPEGWLVAA
ncbi:calcium-binding protein [uncultured Phenylobacterium sp.]|uniref:calcium-binding protein n=1 Tax=uncultured Phenylobacterium sp. TaxID=349273 RepID=UPI0025D7F2BA|nr:calcium-binding protein [uncultured Phenylobacterium sp.]